MDEGPTEEDKANELEARIKAPLIWRHHPRGVRVEDLQDKRFEDAQHLLAKHFLNSEIPFRTTNFIADKESVDDFLANALIQMKDKSSLVAMEEKTGKLMAAAICRVNDRAAYSRTLSKLRFYHGNCYETIMKFYNILEKHVDLHTLYECPKYMKIYSIVIHPKFRKKGFYGEMIKCVKKAAFTAGIPVVAGIFTSGISQAAAAAQGMTKLSEIYYQRYLDKEKQLVFADPGSGNHGAALMAVKIQEEDIKDDEEEAFNSDSDSDDFGEVEP